MEFELCSILTGKSFKIANLSYVSRATHCYVGCPLNCIPVNIHAKPVCVNFSYVQQEMEFQFGSTLPVKSCKIASLFIFIQSLTMCSLYLSYSILLLSMQIQIFPFSMGNRGWNLNLVVHFH